MEVVQLSASGKTSFASCHILHECLHRGVHRDPAARIGRGLLPWLAAASRLAGSPPPHPFHQVWWQGCCQEHCCGYKASQGLRPGSCLRRGCLASFPTCRGHTRWVPVSHRSSWGWGSLVLVHAWPSRMRSGLLEPESDMWYRSVCKI